MPTSTAWRSPPRSPASARDDLDFSVHRDTVTIRGERKDAPEGARAAKRRERRQGSFARTVTLPFPVDPDAVEAHLWRTAPCACR